MAPPPVTAIWAAFSESGKAVAQRRRGHPKEDGVKVDVVADGGRKWIRVNTYVVLFHVLVIILIWTLTVMFAGIGLRTLESLQSSAK